MNTFCTISYKVEDINVNNFHKNAIIFEKYIKILFFNKQSVYKKFLTSLFQFSVIFIL